MKALILGQGGREHALAWKINQSPLCDELYIAPGNGGTHALGIQIDLDLGDFEQVLELIISSAIDIVIVGPEAPLAAGLTDYLNEKAPNVQVIGPGQRGAQLESSKAFSKEFMKRHDIPTASYMSVTNANHKEGHDYMTTMRTPIVLKADGLAAGKGVIIAPSHDEAGATLDAMLDGQFGEASSTVVIEEFLAGREYSVFILTNGKEYYLLPEAKDYKRIGEGDNGPNTGGMGAVSPVSYVDRTLMQRTIDQVIEPTLKGLESEGIPYIGFIFFGMIEVNGEPFVIEYNCRMGDPETEVVLPRIDSDLLAHCQALRDGDLSVAPLEISKNACATVVMVSGGYPNQYEKGYPIKGLENISNSLVFHAGSIVKDNQVKTNGGRVLAVTSLAKSAQEAIETSYKAISHIQFDKQYYRTDIGFDL